MEPRLYSIFVFLVHGYCVVVNLVICVSLMPIRLLYIFDIVSPGFDGTAWEQHLRNEPFCIEWDVKPLLNNSTYKYLEMRCIHLAHSN